MKQPASQRPAESSQPSQVVGAVSSVDGELVTLTVKTLLDGKKTFSFTAALASNVARDLRNAAEEAKLRADKRGGRG